MFTILSLGVTTSHSVVYQLAGFHLVHVFPSFPRNVKLFSFFQILPATATATATAGTSVTVSQVITLSTTGILFEHERRGTPEQHNP
jgi:hypothetical protein